MIFNSEQTKIVIKYIEETYGAEPEFLWERYPNAAVLRHSTNSKWFAVIMKVPEKKLGMQGSSEIEILDLKCEPMLIDGLLGNSGFLPGYHMNKKYWITILLNGSVANDEIYNLIDMSYDLTKKKIKEKKGQHIGRYVYPKYEISSDTIKKQGKEFITIII